MKEESAQKKVEVAQGLQKQSSPGKNALYQKMRFQNTLAEGEKYVDKSLLNLNWLVNFVLNKRTRFSNM